MAYLFLLDSATLEGGNEVDKGGSLSTHSFSFMDTQKNLIQQGPCVTCLLGP